MREKLDAFKLAENKKQHSSLLNSFPSLSLLFSLSFALSLFYLPLACNLESADSSDSTSVLN